MENISTTAIGNNEENNCEKSYEKKKAKKNFIENLRDSRHPLLLCTLLHLYGQYF